MGLTQFFIDLRTDNRQRNCYWQDRGEDGGRGRTWQLSPFLSGNKLKTLSEQSVSTPPAPEELPEEHTHTQTGLGPEQVYWPGLLIRFHWSPCTCRWRTVSMLGGTCREGFWGQSQWLCSEFLRQRLTSSGHAAPTDTQTQTNIQSEPSHSLTDGGRTGLCGLTYHSDVTEQHWALRVDAQSLLEMDFCKVELFLFVVNHSQSVPNTNKQTGNDVSVEAISLASTNEQPH